MKFAELGSDWQGRDASLEVALFDQGFIWREVGPVWQIIYASGEGLFSRAEHPRSQSVSAPHPLLRDPAEQAKLSSYTGEPWGSFLTRELPEILATLAQYYGHENIFGSHPRRFAIEPPMPAEVATVAALASASAVAAGQHEERAYCHYTRYPSGGEWSITDNYDTGLTGGSLIYRHRQWWWRPWYSTVPDSELPGGFAEAQEAARIFFTG
jgi:hypothetical protein